MKLLMSIIEKGRFLALTFVLLGCLTIQAADDLITQQITIKLDEAGTLPNRISNSKKYKITNLKIIGEINGTDVRLIRDMAGAGLDFTQSYERTDGKLRELDLSEARFVEGGDWYCILGRGDNPKYHAYTENDKVGIACFLDCRLTKVVLPNNVTSIGGAAFGSCDITTLAIPYSVTRIDDQAFDSSSLIELDIPESVVDMGFQVFEYCRDLTRVTISPNVTSLKGGTFKGCVSLKSLDVPHGVTDIYNEVCTGCTSLESLRLPFSLTNIASWAFYGCTSLTSVYVNWNTPLKIDESVFRQLDKQKCTLYVPKGTFQDYWLADEWGDFGNIVEYDVTGVDKVTISTDAMEVSRYSINGQRLSAPTKGLNVVKYSDGSVKKVAVQ